MWKYLLSYFVFFFTHGSLWSLWASAGWNSLSVKLQSSYVGWEALTRAGARGRRAGSRRNANLVFMVFPFVSRLRQLLRGVTISNGGVLPRIHPELLSKKRGSRVKVDSQATVPEKPAEHSKSKKPVKPPKKVKGKRGRKPKVSRQGGATATWLCMQALLK